MTNWPFRSPNRGKLLRGMVDRVRGVFVEGWVWDPARPSVPLCVEVWLGGELVAVTVANRFRGDLLSAGIGEGDHSFVAALPPDRDATIDNIHVREVESEWTVPGGADGMGANKTTSNMLRAAQEARALMTRVRRSHQLNETIRRKQADALRRQAQQTGVTPDSSPDVTAPTHHKADVIILPPINWHYRFQRPQQLALELARRGHRVFYVATDFHADEPSVAVTDEPAPNLYLIRLRCSLPHPVINVDPANAAQQGCLGEALGDLNRTWAIKTPVYVIGNPFWNDVLPTGNRVVLYDCMDLLSGFDATSSGLKASEQRLIEAADMIVVSSAPLKDTVTTLAPDRPSLMIRNAAHAAFFQVPPAKKTEQIVIGYVGAIEDWFDGDLLLELAGRRTDWRFEIAGNVGDSQQHLVDSAPENVTFHGEIPFEQVPDFIEKLNLALIPFRPTELIRHTNPVKVYEYLAAGRPVVATPIPELDSFGEFVAQVESAEAAEEAIEHSLLQCGNQSDIARRMAVLSETWDVRGSELSTLIQVLHGASEHGSIGQ